MIKITEDTDLTSFLMAIPTVYGYVAKKGHFDIKKPINNKQMLEEYIEGVSSVIKEVLLKEFEKLENENKNEVTNEQGQ